SPPPTHPLSLHDALPIYPQQPLMIDGRAAEQLRDVQRQDQAEEDQPHQPQGAARRRRAAQQPGEQGQQDGEHVGHQQGQRHRDTRHGRVQAQALHGDQQPEQQLPATAARRQPPGLALHQQQGGQYQEGQPGAEQDGQHDPGSTVEGQSRGDVVGSKDAGQTGQDQYGQGTTERTNGWGHGARTGKTGAPRGRAAYAAARRFAKALSINTT